ncbi:histone deacetylase family protein [Luminiphilus sp.]|nr:histone deacetylase family protein [Luminiphilus sp.]MDA9711430.1 histone deacetylase family protein [Luminiphilus sp.]
MLIYSHPCCIQHETPDGHPERSDRLTHLLTHLTNTGFTQDHPVTEAPPIEATKIAQAHHPNLLERLAQSVPKRGLTSVDQDTWMGSSSLLAALQAAGSVWQGVIDVVAGAETRVFCAVRPPGHHAEFDCPMGFCLLNSVAIAAINSLNLPDVERVAILDFDVHHGNGTVDLCRHHPDILVCSSFQHPHYPHRLHDLVSENIVNTPLEAGASGDDFRRAINNSWWPAIEAHKPNLIFVSAGFDAHRADPLAQINLVEADFAWVTSEIAALADQFADGRIVSTLEGGYDLEALANSVLAHLQALAK